MPLEPSTRATLQSRSSRGVHAVIAFLVLLALLCGPASLRAQEPAPTASAVYVVAHVDVVPPSADAALALLEAYATSRRQVLGSQRFEVLREAGRPNHFTLVEVWQSEAARQANEASATTRRFRDQLQSLLGSPFDERLQQLAQP